MKTITKILCLVLCVVLLLPLLTACVTGTPGQNGKDGINGNDGKDGKDGKNGRGIETMEWVDGELIVTYTDGTTQNLGNPNKTNEDDENKGNNDDTNPPTDGWVDKVDTIYTGVNNLNLRLEPSINAAKVTTISAAGTALNRVATNGTWDKVEIGEGDAKQTAYVLNAFVSQVSTNFSFTTLPAENQSTLTIVGDNKINLRSTPFVPGGDNNYDNVVISEFNASYGTLTKVAVSASGNWYQVSYTGTIGTKTYNGTEALYVTASVVSGGWVADSAGSIGGGSLG